MNLVKKISATCTLCCVSFLSWSQFDLKLSELGMKGAVAAIEETEYQADNNASLKEMRRVSLIFNGKGCKTEEKYSSPEGEVSYSAVFKYSPAGELTEEIVKNYGHSKDFTRTYHFEKNKITVGIKHESASVQLYAEYLLNSAGKATQRTDYDDSGAVFRTLKYSYSGSLLQSETQNVQSSVLQFKYSYDDKGRLNKKAEVTPNGKVTHTTAYTYDDKGNPLSENSSYTGDSEKITISYVYVFDSAGNWTEKRESMNGNLFSVLKRKITYY